MLAMDVNDYACLLVERGALESIASIRASTGCSYKRASRSDQMQMVVPEPRRQFQRFGGQICLAAIVVPATPLA